MQRYLPSRPGVHGIHACLCGPHVGTVHAAVCRTEIGQAVTCTKARGTREEEGFGWEGRRQVICEGKAELTEAVIDSPSAPPRQKTISQQ